MLLRAWDLLSMDVFNWLWTFISQIKYVWPASCRGEENNSFKPSRGHLSIKMPSCQCGNSDYKDKMAVRPSYLYNENPYTWQNHLYIETGPCCCVLWHCIYHYHHLKCFNIFQDLLCHLNDVIWASFLSTILKLKSFEMWPATWPFFLDHSML